ncbi:MAG: hypothetical protein NT099_03395 [Candidatus Saganbacteria bacterium]|nr:hypothetical protein [Candidatus Saganbacteria bacterium]
MAMEILGLIDTLESVILEGNRVPLTKKIMVDEAKVLSLIDKIRLVVQGGGDYAKKIIDKDFKSEGEAHFTPGQEESKSENNAIPEGMMGDNKSMEVIQQAYQMAKEVRVGADKYADEVLSNLEAAAGRVLRTIQAGRDRLKKNLGNNMGSSAQSAEKETE